MFVNQLFKLLLLPIMLLSIQAQAAVKIQHWQTAKGAEVYFVENHDLPIIDLSINFAAGSARDEKTLSGLAGITRHLMTLGAAGLSDEEISKRIADVGAIIGGELDDDRASLKLRTLSSPREREQALDIFTKILQQPDFPETVLTREKARTIAGLKEAATQPENIANKAFMKALYGDHPYALEVSGDPETITAIKREDLQKFYQNHYGAKGAVIALIGDMSRDEAVTAAERITANLPEAPANKALPAVNYPDKASELRIPHPATQSHILLGYPGAKRGDADYYPLYVGNYILGAAALSHA